MKAGVALTIVIYYLGIKVLAQNGYNYQNSNSLKGNYIDSIPGKIS